MSRTSVFTVRGCDSIAVCARDRLAAAAIAAAPVDLRNSRRVGGMALHLNSGLLRYNRFGRGRSRPAIPKTVGSKRRPAKSVSMSLMTRFVVADASPLIGLATAGALHLLRELYGTVTITRLVKDEVTGDPTRQGARELDTAMREGWVRVAPAPPETWRLAGLDSGEASTLALAAQQEGALVLIDDAQGRAQAASLGLEVLDLAHVLLAAKRAGLVTAVRPLLARLVRAGFTMPKDARRDLLRDVGE